MAKTKFVKGDKVKVRYEGVIEAVYSGNEVYVRDSGGYLHTYYPDDTDVAVKKIVPFEPQVGDIYRVRNGDGFVEYSVRKHWADDGVVLSQMDATQGIGQDLQSDYYETSLAVFVKLNPKLVRRRG